MFLKRITQKQKKGGFYWIVSCIISVLILNNLVVWHIPYLFTKPAFAEESSNIRFFGDFKDSNASILANQNDDYLVTDSFLKAYNVPLQPVRKINQVVITAYSSTIEETDDSPFVTANGTTVRDGIVAANFLSFGTKIQIPAIFGDKTFIVEDRMAPKNNGKVDIWFSDKKSALKFGVKIAEIVVVE